MGFNMGWAMRMELHGVSGSKSMHYEGVRAVNRDLANI